MGFADLPPDLISDGLAGTKSTREAAKKTDELSASADENLFALAQAEIAYFDREKRSPRLSIVAEGNLDKDDFVDRWLIQYDGKKRCPSATILAMDALNATFEGKPTGDVPYLIVPQGKTQPRLVEF